MDTDTQPLTATTVIDRGAAADDMEATTSSSTGGSSGSTGNNSDRSAAHDIYHHHVTTTTPIATITTIVVEKPVHLQQQQQHRQIDIDNDNDDFDIDENDCHNNNEHQRLLIEPPLIATTTPAVSDTVKSPFVVTSSRCDTVIRSCCRCCGDRDYYTTSSNNNDDDNNNTMSFKTSYSMISTPRNSPSSSSSSASLFNNNTTSHHYTHKTTWFGWMICSLFTLLVLLIAYQQFIFQENERSQQMIQVGVTTTTTTARQKTTAVSQEQQQRNKRKKSIIIPPPSTYNYPPTLEEEKNEDLHHMPIKQAPQQSPLDVVWLMSFPGTLGLSHVIDSLELYSQTTTATNYGATLLFRPSHNGRSTTGTDTNDATPNNENDAINDVLVNPIYAVHPSEQCGPFIHRMDLPMPSSGRSIVTNTYCSTAQTTSSTVVCTECIPKYHNLLTFERACATGNRLYEQHYRSVQYDTRIPSKYIHVVQNPFLSFMNRLRITFQQKYTISINAQQQGQEQNHHFDYFQQYIPSRNGQIKEDVWKRNNNKRHRLKTSVSILEYCQYLDTTYATLATTDLLSNYTHVPCHAEFYKYIQWYNDAVSLTTIKYNTNTNDDDEEDDTDTNSDKPVHYIYYEQYISDLLQRRQGRLSSSSNTMKCDRSSSGNNSNNDAVVELFDFLNLTIPMVTNRTYEQQQEVLYDSIVSETSSYIFGMTDLPCESGNDDNHHHSVVADSMMTSNIIKYLPLSVLQGAADMMYELALPTTWELLRHYLEPFLSSTTKRNHHPHLFHHLKNRHHRKEESIPMSLLIDGKIRDDSIILSPLLFNDYIDTLYENAFHDHDVSIQQPEPNDPNPQVVWLLSFPNSGTSYTINNLEVSCNVTTGSNYAKDWDTIVPIRPELSNGPFIHDTTLRIPHYVMTKTHCFGYCDDCGPHIYNITNNEIFEQGCLRAEMTNHTGSVRYDNSVPVKAIHLYRSPFDNIVARMHLAVHKRQRQQQGNNNDNDIDASLFTNSRDGLTAWCSYLDAKYSDVEEEFFTPTILQLFKHVPCHADWYRYVQWHNHAYIMTEKLQLPVYDLFYEDYTHDYDRTILTLFDYLNVTQKQSSIDFYVGKSYEMFFDVDHAKNAAILVEAIAIPAVWLRLRHYFEDYM